jgi:hypothetical protein
VLKLVLEDFDLGEELLFDVLGHSESRAASGMAHTAKK